MSDLMLTPRLRIHPFGESDIEPSYIAWLNDPALMRFSNQRFVRHDRESCARYVASFAGTPHLFVGVRLRADSALIGTMTAYADERHGRADMGILIGHPRARGRGYALEAWTALMRFLFDARAVRKITAGTMRENAAMCRLAERAGMRPDGVRQRHNLLDGREVDIVHYAAFRGEWTPPRIEEERG
jgi:RimJ/RimL family protein N-acetyltransferase